VGAAAPSEWSLYPAQHPVRLNGQRLIMTDGWTLTQTGGVGIISYADVWATTNALTIGSTTLRLGVTGGTMGFLGHTVGATRQVVPVAVGATTAIQALQALGLFSQS
jgi:hypothetical protein